jgi:predicted RNA-binding Zn-ribbon protein involved in translation (DUF1610 family)
MIAEITATWTALNAAVKGIASVLKTVDDVKIKEAISGIQDSLLDVQSKLLAAQAQYEQLADAKRQAEQKLTSYEKWDTESARYALKEIVSGIFVYALKPDQANGEPVHWLCPNCFQERQKSILSKPRVDNLNYKCNRCSFDVAPTSAYPRTGIGGFIPADSEDF